MRTNCLIWAVGRYVRLEAAWLRAGAPRGVEPHLWVRSSRLAPWWVPTFGVAHWDAERGQWAREKFVPDDSGRLRWWQTWRKFWFPGRVVITYQERDDA